MAHSTVVALGIEELISLLPSTPYSRSESGFISVSCAKFLLFAHAMLTYLVSALLTGNCRSSISISALGRLPFSCAQAVFFSLQVLRSHQLNVFRPPSRLGDHTNIPIIFCSLITSNLLQSIGTLVDLRWMLGGGVFSGSLCSFQGSF